MTNIINNATSSDVVADTIIASTVFDTPSQRKLQIKPIPHEWRSPSPNELGKRVIHGRPHTYNNNGSWKPDTTPDSSLTSEDAAAATAIATDIASTLSTSPTTIAVISIT